jgi:hypothetical protein
MASAIYQTRMRCDLKCHSLFVTANEKCGLGLDVNFSLFIVYTHVLHDLILKGTRGSANFSVGFQQKVHASDVAALVVSFMFKSFIWR